MTVYVLEEGEYEQAGVVGVFDSLEAAKAATRNASWVHYKSDSYESWDSEDGDSASISAYVVQSDKSEVTS